jgi:protein SCO1
VYYGCPGLCTATLTGVAAAIDDVTLNLGGDYRIVTVSFNPQEGTHLAASKRDSYLRTLRSSGERDPEGWVFLTGPAESIERLTQAVGFRYRWVEATGEFAHDTAAIIATPDGRVSRYLRGAFYDPSTFRLSLVEASSGRIGTLSDRIRVRICGYDPRQGKYVVMAQTIMMIGGGATILAVVAVVVLLTRLEHHRRKRISVRDVQPHAA